ncbi:MAG: OmpA family protein [Gammaproteobacteria bacterium]
MSERTNRLAVSAIELSVMRTTALTRPRPTATAFHRLLFLLRFLLPIAVLCALSIGANAASEGVFAGAEQARATALAADAAALSPKTFARAEADLEDARKDAAKGRKADRIRRNLTEAEGGFRKALENAEIAALTLRDEIDSRDAALAARADELVPREMTDALELFLTATVTLEKGNLKGAQKAGLRANDALRATELNAIRTEHLSVAKSLVAQARAADAEEFAPRTFARAEKLLADADAALVADRYSVQPAIELAARAEYEARHAMFVAAVAERVRRKEITPEDVVIDWESALVAIADEFEFDPDLSAGYAATRDEIIDYAREFIELRERVEQQNVQILGLEEEIRDLDARLGGAAKDRSQLIRQVERQARVREQFEQIRNTFAPGEAIVLRDGDQIIIRLIGLRFASNSARIDPSFAPLLQKVDAAIDVFPQCSVIVEGHTDSMGTVARNLALSEERAGAVVNYMTSELKIPAFRIRAVGYGDSRPIASNRTNDGRVKNRRIDIVIEPRPESL